MCPFELTATPGTSPKFMPAGSFRKAALESNGMSGTVCCADALAAASRTDAQSRSLMDASLTRAMIHSPRWREPMHRAKLLVLAAAVLALPLTMLAQNNVTVFEGARVIVGDGRAPIENATFIVTGNRFTAVGRAADVRVPAGATRVHLAGKTVLPTILDTHTHLSQTREMLVDDLKRRVY